MTKETLAAVFAAFADPALDDAGKKEHARAARAVIAKATRSAT